jgi:hypothetical protein
MNLPQVTAIRLESLSLKEALNGDPVDLRCMKFLEVLHITRGLFSDMFLPPTVKDLELKQCEISTTAGAGTFSFPALNSLESLTFEDCQLFSSSPFDTDIPEFLRQAAAKSRPGILSTLRLHWSSSPSLGFITSDWFRGLTSLVVKNGRFRNEDGAALIGHCPDLYFLWIHDQYLTGVFLSDMIKASSKLRRIMAVDCYKISKDIVPWAKARDVNIKLTTSSEDRSGQRLREWMD